MNGSIGVKEVRYNAHLPGTLHDWEPAVVRCSCGGWYAVQAATVDSRELHRRCYLGPKSARFYLGSDLRERLAEECGSSRADFLIGCLIAALLAFAIVLGGTVAP